MRRVLATLAVAGVALTACGEPEPAGGALPPPSEVSTGSTPTSTIAPGPTAPEQVVGSEGPYDPAATLQPDLMTIEPSVVPAGGEVAVRFPGGRDRGIAYVLEVETDGVWSTTHFLTAATEGYGVTPTWASFGTDGYGWEDIGISGPGPDSLIVPDSAFAGDSRICTANSRENICAEVTVLGPVGSPTPGSEPTSVEATVVAVYDDVEFYPACGNETLEHEGVVWYQVQEYDYPDVYERAVNGPREQPPDSVPVRGFARRVVAPGPGDDVGTLVVWSDDVAYFTSDSGDLDAWLVAVELTYNWEC